MQGGLMKGAITLGEGCIDNQPSRLANCSSIEMNTKIGENRRPSELLRLSFLRVEKKINRTRDRTTMRLFCL